MPPLDAETVRAVVERELGARLEDAFDAFDMAPLGSASIAQVHRATLKGGGRAREVAVKVQRPSVEVKMMDDVANLKVEPRPPRAIAPRARDIARRVPARARSAF